MTIPLGMCQCGCGAKTGIAPQGDTRKGYKKGVPRSYLPGHQQKVRRSVVNYRRNEEGRYEHLAIAERVLGKPLPPGAEVHHVNSKKWDNRHSNLVICQDRPYHRLLHQRTRAYRACGNASFRKCQHCRKWDDPASMYVTPDNSYHVACRVIYNRSHRAAS